MLGSAGLEFLQLPGNLTLVDVQPSLWHVAHPSLRLLTAVGVEEMNIGGFFCYLKVANAAIPLWKTLAIQCEKSD